MNRAALALAAFIALAGCDSSPRPAWADGRMVTEEVRGGGQAQDLSRFEARLLAVHNRERAATGARPLVWDAALAAASASYGPALERLGKLAHSPANMRHGQGENLWMGTRDAYELEEMAEGWAAEKSLFRPGFFPSVSRSGRWSDVSHYTQMIWKGTARVGCAVHKSRKWDFLICRYSPHGNVVGQRVP
jgi:hypothetical protein